MKHHAQCWILTIEHSGSQGALGVLTVCGDGTGLVPESYESSGSLSTIFQELECVLDATMNGFEHVANGGVPGQGRLPLQYP